MWSVAFAAVSMSASAWNVNQAPALVAPPAPENPLQKLAKAPLNVGRDLGVDMFASVLVDRDLDHSLAWFKSERPYSLDKRIKVFPAYDAQNSRMYGLGTGCMAGDGYYYGYRLKMYTFENRVNGFLKINPETGEWTELNNWENDDKYQVEWNKRYVYDMAYNPSDGKVYALGTDPESVSENVNEPVKSLLMEVNLADGTTRTVAHLPSYYFAVAFDWNGKLYGVTWVYKISEDGKNVELTGTRFDRMDPDLDYEIDRKTPMLVDDKAFVSYYQHGMDFDYTTGDLWWLATQPENTSMMLSQYLVKIDPETGETVNKGKMGQNEALVGLYIPYRTADSRTAPAKVENLGYKVDDTGASKVTLTWTNPTTRWNRRALDNLSEVLVFRDNLDGDPVATLDAKGQEGKTMSYTDEGASRGVHTYYVLGSCVKGEFGISESIDAFVGHDVPGPVTNLVASSSDGRTVKVTWDLPARGDSEGWFDNSDLSYTVTRFPDNKVVATAVKDREVIDSDIPTATLYTYQVVPISADGEGTPELSNEVFAGKDVAIPFESTLEDEVEANRFISIDGNGDGARFVHDMCNQLRRKCMILDMNKSSNDDYLVSPPMAVKPGRTYRVDVDIEGHKFGYETDVTTHKFRFVGGEGASLKGLNDELLVIDDYKMPGLYPSAHFSVDFVAPSETYYVAFNVCGSVGEDFWIYVSNFRVVEVMDNDMAVSAFTPHLSLSKDIDNEFEVEVWNYGTKAQSDYKVKVGTVNGSGTFFPFAEAESVPSLAPGEKATVKVKGHPVSEDDIAIIAAEVEMASDENADNDRSQEWNTRLYKGQPITVVVTGDKINEDSSAPVYYYYPYSAVQTVYTPDMMNFPSDVEEVGLSSLSWKYRGEASTTTMDVKVYLGSTSETGYDHDSKDWYDVGQDKVFDGVIEMKEGVNYMTAVFDREYVFDPNRSLVVTVVKSDPNLVGTFSFFFDVFDEDWEMPEFHSITFRGNEPFDFSKLGSLNTNDIFTLPMAPVLFLGAKYESGVGEISAGRHGESVMVYDAASKSLRFDGMDIVRVNVYSLDGRGLASTGVTDGASAVAVRLEPGIYVAGATDAAGNVHTLKFSVR